MAYWDTTTATPILACAIDASAAYCRSVGFPPNIAGHERGGRATALVQRARQRVARFINGHESEVIFTRNATEAIRLAADTYQFPSNADVIVAEGERYSTLLAWLGRRHPKAVVLRNRADGSYDEEHLATLVSAKTRLIVCSLVNHVTGALNPVARIVEIARAHKALVLVDATNAVGRIPIDVDALGCDFLVFSSTHAYSVPGVGVLWVRRGTLDEMVFRLGGGAVHRVDAGGRWLVPADLPERAESGTSNGPAIMALEAALDTLDRIGMAAIADHERELGRRMLELLNDLPGVGILGRQPGDDGVAIASFTLTIGSRMVTCVQLQTICSDAYGLLCAAGSLDAAPMLARFACADGVRLGGGIHTATSDFDKLAEALHSVLGKR